MLAKVFLSRTAVAAALLLSSVSGQGSVLDVFSQNPGCSLCPTGYEMTAGDTVLAVNTAGIIQQETTCMGANVLANGGSYSPAACTLLRAQVQDMCGCVAPETPAPMATPTDVTEAPAAAPVDVMVTEAPVMPDVTDAPVVAPTDAPVAAPTDAPVPAPTDAPVMATEAPVVAETEAPVAAPTDAPVMATEAPVMATEAPMAAPTDAPVMATEAPVVAPVAPPTDAPVAAPVEPVEVTTEITLRLNTTGEYTEDAQAALEEACNAFLAENVPDVPGLMCTFLSSGRRFLRALQEEGEVTVSVTGTTDLSAEELNTLVAGAFADNPEAFAELLADNEFFANVTGPEVVVAATDAPVAAPTEDSNPSEEPESSDDGLSGGAIFGILVAAAIGLGAVIGGAYYMSKSQDSGDRVVAPSAAASDSVARPMPAAAAKPPAPVVRAPAPVAAVAAINAASSLRSGSSSVGGDGSQITGSAMEGFSVAPGNVEGGTAVGGSKKSGGESGEGGTSASGDEMSSHAMSSLRQNMVSRTVIAPPGKLGIVIDTTLEGPVVHKVNSASPLEGTLFTGDIIVAIDDVDTRAMSASAITALMVRTANLRRKLTVLSEDVTN